MVILDYLGSSVLVVLLAMVIVNLFHARKLQFKGVMGYTVVTMIVLLMLLRT